MLFKNAGILDDKFNYRENRYVAVEGDRITYIGESEPAGDFGEVKDCRGRMLMSGFYNAHAHSPMTLMRGYGENMSLNDWLFKKIFPFEDKLDGNAVYWGTMLAMAESLRYGIVSTSDMYYFCEDMARAVVESGAKANISRSVTNPSGEDPEKLVSIREAVEFYRNYHNSAGGRLKVDMSLHGEYTSDLPTAKLLGEITRDLGDTVMHVHVSETESEHRECIERHGMTPAAYLEAAGIFSVPSIAAHCIWATDEDLEIFRRNRVTVAANPTSNMKLASGILDSVNVIDKGVKLALGTDSVASNNNLSMLEEIKLLMIGSKIAAGSPEGVSPEDALEAATLGGARAQGRGDCGILREGNKADLILVDVSQPNMQPVHSIINNMVYSCSDGNIEMTMVDGRILYEKGEYRTIDIEKTVYEATEATKGILKKL